MLSLKVLIVLICQSHIKAKSTFMNDILALERFENRFEVELSLLKRVYENLFVLYEALSKTLDSRRDERKIIDSQNKKYLAYKIKFIRKFRENVSKFIHKISYLSRMKHHKLRRFNKISETLKYPYQQNNTANLCEPHSLGKNIRISLFLAKINFLDRMICKKFLSAMFSLACSQNRCIHSFLTEKRSPDSAIHFLKTQFFRTLLKCIHGFKKKFYTLAQTYESFIQNKSQSLKFMKFDRRTCQISFDTKIHDQKKDDNIFPEKAEETYTIPKSVSWETFFRGVRSSGDELSQSDTQSPHLQIMTMEDLEESGSIFDKSTVPRLLSDFEQQFTYNKDENYGVRKQGPLRFNALKSSDSKSTRSKECLSDRRARFKRSFTDVRSFQKAEGPFGASLDDQNQNLEKNPSSAELFEKDAFESIIYNDRLNSNHTIFLKSKTKIAYLEKKLTSNKSLVISNLKNYMEMRMREFQEQIIPHSSAIEHNLRNFILEKFSQLNNMIKDVCEDLLKELMKILDRIRDNAGFQLPITMREKLYTIYSEAVVKFINHLEKKQVTITSVLIRNVLSTYWNFLDAIIQCLHRESKGWLLGSSKMLDFINTIENGLQNWISSSFLDIKKPDGDLFKTYILDLNGLYYYTSLSNHITLENTRKVALNFKNILSQSEKRLEILKKYLIMSLQSDMKKIKSESFNAILQMLFSNLRINVSNFLKDMGFLVNNI